ncbi:MAG: endo-1,4-beta-xylanase [Chitinophagales bacterium]|nr:endo-1,4-beta-xylanase [Chitinophagales bacterium]
MRPIITIILFCTVTLVRAQDAYHQALSNKLQTDFALPANAQWVLPNTETATLSASFAYGATVSNTNPAGALFTQARLYSINQGNNPWDAAHAYTNTSAISAGDKCLFVLWLRTNSPAASVNLFVENNVTYAKEVFATVSVSAEWRMYAASFSSSAAYQAGKLNLGVHLANLTQVIEVGGAACLNYQNQVQLSQLPILLYNDAYAGMEPDAPWRAEAAASIDQLRKANLSVLVKDNAGNPLPDAQVYVEMQRHQYAFGTAVVSSMFNFGSSQNDVYEQKMLNLDGAGHGFNEVVFENDLKWRAWEEHWGGTSWDDIALDVQWLKDHEITIRGHNLVWPGWEYSPADLELNQNNPGYLRNRIRNHLNAILGYPGVGTEMVDWDVLNEITYNNDFANALAGTPGYPTGREIYAEIFRQADSLAPNSTMYLNDYVAIERGDAPNDGIVVWKSRIDELLAVGAPVEGIGFQGHIGVAPTGIPKVKEIMDDFWNTYGLPAKITEYDINSLVPPETQARYMRDFLTITFAHPSMQGFLMWGFWDGAHWLGNAPIFNQDWSLKPSGEAFVDQVFHQWWTNEQKSTSSQGTATVRGFKGKYRVRVACGNAIQERDVWLDSDKTEEFTLNCTTRTRDVNNSPTFMLQPSLASQGCTIAWLNAQQVDHLMVVDISGKRWLEQHFPTRLSQWVDTSNWPNGIYLVQCMQNGKTATQRMLVQH